MIWSWSFFQLLSFVKKKTIHQIQTDLVSFHCIFLMISTWFKTISKFIWPDPPRRWNLFITTFGSLKFRRKFLVYLFFQQTLRQPVEKSITPFKFVSYNLSGRRFFVQSSLKPLAFLERYISRINFWFFFLTKHFSRNP